MDRKQAHRELQQVLKLKDRVTSALRRAPEGTLWCQMNKNRYPQYFLISHGDPRQQERSEHGGSAHGISGHGLSEHGGSAHGISEHGLSEHGGSAHGISGLETSVHSITGHGKKNQSTENSGQMTPLPSKGRLTRHYLTTKDLPLIRNLAQKEYNITLLKKLHNQEKALRDFLEHYEEDILGAAYDKIPPAKRLMVKPYRPTDEEFIAQWKKEHSGQANPYPKKTQYLTEQGEYVRSKSEKIFLDKLFHLGIPYVYECPLVLEDGRTIYPDVTVLNVRTRKTKYIELFGMMDNPVYCNSSLEKIKDYNKNKLYTGESFLFLMESSECVLDIEQMDRLIQTHLL